MRTVALALALLLAGPLAGPGLASEEPSPLLPDLAMAPPADFSVQKKAGGGRWLRFSTIVLNIGDGPFDIHGHDADGAAIERTNVLAVRQRIRDSAGSWAVHDRPATMTYSGDGHDHWHVHGLQQYDLAFEATPAETIASGNKTGFCFYDTDHYSGDEPRHYYPGTVNVCHVENETVRMGLTVGWGDKYPASISGQYIDISGLPYGTYWLTVTADPSGEFFEKSAGNNEHRSKIRIERSGVTLLYQDPAPGGTDTTAPAAPTGLTAQGGDTTVSLDWTGNAERDLSHYGVYRLAGEEYTLLADTTVSGYTDTGLENGTRYCYRVTAIDTAGNESAPSDACAEPTGGGTATTVHIADLDGSSSNDGRYWIGTVVAQVHDANHGAVAGATVSGTWSAGDGAVPQCETGEDGRCTLRSATIPKSTGSATFSVTAVYSADTTYAPADNHDSDGDSDGTSIHVSKP